MLTEIALTPQTFQPWSVEDKGWAEQLRALNTRLRYIGFPCPIVFSNLNGGDASVDWLAVVDRLIGALPSKKRQPAIDLTTWLRRGDHVVSRPSHNNVHSADDETQWVKEGRGPAAEYRIDQIVASRQGVSACRKVDADVLGMHELDKAGFWSNVTIASSVAPNIDAQVEALRPIWLHAEVLAVVLPYALSSETAWFLALARRALTRPAGHGIPSIELHVSIDRDAQDLIAQGANHPTIRYFEGLATAALPPGAAISLHIRARKPKAPQKEQYIARRLFGGILKDVGTGIPFGKIRWGVSLEHVAQSGEPALQTAPTFSLLRREMAQAQFEFECRSSRLLGPVFIKC